MITTTITVRRPNGTVEIVDASDKFPVGLNDKLFAQIKDGIRKAGRGECLSYETVRIDTRTEAQKERDAVEALYDAALALVDDPARLFPARNKADAAMAAWQAKYPAEAVAERTEAERKTRKAEYTSDPNSFYNRALRGED